MMEEYIDVGSDPTVYFLPSEHRPQSPFDAWIDAVIRSSQTWTAVPIVSRLVVDVQRWTEWSNRQFAAILDTTHPTIASLANGGSLGVRSTGIRQRIAQIHSVVARLAALGLTPSALRMRLEIADEAGLSSLDYLRGGDAPGAYLSATRASQHASTRMRPTHRARAGAANADLAEELSPAPDAP